MVLGVSGKVRSQQVCEIELFCVVGDFQIVYLGDVFGKVILDVIVYYCWIGVFVVIVIVFVKMQSGFVFIMMFGRSCGDVIMKVVV